MARPWRIEFEGAFYHVLSRGNERRNIFKDDENRLSFLETLGEMAERFDVNIYAFVLMHNHYHLLIKTQRANLSKSMQWFGATYTRRYNLKLRRSGHLFQGRFKSILVENEEYLMRLSCYIHRNPLRARMVNRLADYRWSSYPAYAYGKNSPEWLTTQGILSQFGNENKHEAYRKMVQEYSGEEEKSWEDFRHGLLLGTREFVDRIRSEYLSEKPDVEVPQKRLLLKPTDPKIFIEKAAMYLNCDMNDYFRQNRISKSDKDKRDLLIFLLWQTGVFRNYEIGKLFGIGYSSISRRVTLIKSRLDKDREIKKEYERIKTLIKM